MLQSRWFVGAMSMIVGAVLAANVAGLWPQVAVHASATHGQDNFAIATGPVSSDIEAIYLLDYLTGDLKAAVINLQTGKFMSLYEWNVGQDLGAGSTKNPRYLMVTGLASMRRGGLGQLGSSVVYVTEISSGQIMAYGLPWTAGRELAQVPFKGQLIPLDSLHFRAAVH
jgi:hypothetical protein